jgi:hypothetical protein
MPKVILRQYIFILTKMCYLKNLKLDDSIDLDDMMKKAEDT